MQTRAPVHMCGKVFRLVEQCLQKCAGLALEGGVESFENCPAAHKASHHATLITESRAILIESDESVDSKLCGNEELRPEWQL